MPIGGNPRRLSFWEPLLNRIKSRLSGWSSKHLSFGGRLILLKSVLSSLPVYALSFFKAPTGIISSIESLFNCFFWGGSADHRKISWVDWTSICRSKEVGGLGVRRIREFNVALLGKWCWRLLEERDSLWFRVLSARYDTDEGRLRGGGREASEWWRVVHSLSRENWFGDHVSRRVGNGRTTLFWSDVWCGRVSFRVRFNRLFELSVFKGESVLAMSQLGWGEGGEAWRWRRLFVWEEEMMGELILLLANVTMQVNKEDKWLWTLENSNTFIVRSLYNFLAIQPQVGLPVDVSSIWHKDVPLKVVLFGWRLFRDRLPTKDNLLRRSVIDHDSRMCVAGCDLVESSSHLFLHCNTFGTVWHLIYRWIGVSVINPFYVPDHFHQFGFSGGIGRKRRSILQVIWYAAVWEIWKERNNRLFKGKELMPHSSGG